MTDKDKYTVIKCLESGGFDLTFTEFTLFDDLPDKEFQKLKNNYIKARKDLAEYLNYEY